MLREPFYQNCFLRLPLPVCQRFYFHCAQLISQRQSGSSSIFCWCHLTSASLASLRMEGCSTASLGFRFVSVVASSRSANIGQTDFASVWRLDGAEMIYQPRSAANCRRPRTPATLSALVWNTYSPCGRSSQNLSKYFHKYILSRLLLQPC